MIWRLLCRGELPETDAGIRSLAQQWACSPATIRKDILLQRAAFDSAALEDIVRLKWSGCCKRAELAGVINDLDWSRFLQLYQESTGECAYCRRKLTNKAQLIADHIHPMAKGGSNTIENIVLACSACNMAKGDRLLDDLEDA